LPSSVGGGEYSVIFTEKLRELLEKHALYFEEGFWALLFDLLFNDIKCKSMYL